MNNTITIEEWELPALPTFDDCVVEVDFDIDDNVITRLRKINCVFRKKGCVEQSRQLNGIPTVLEKQIVQLLEDDIDNIVNYIEGT